MEKKSQFEKIVQNEMKKVFNLSYKLCGDLHQANDITQETFLRAYQSFEKFQGRSQMFTYLYRITCNVWKNSLRKRKFQALTSYLPDGAKQVDPPSKDISPYEEMKRKDKAMLVRRCLDTLHPKEKAIIVLRDMEDRPYEEIAAILNCRLGTVKSRLARARRKLSLEMMPYMEVLDK